MRVLQGLDHPNVVRPISPHAIYLPPSSFHARVRAYRRLGV